MMNEIIGKLNKSIKKYNGGKQKDFLFIHAIRIIACISIVLYHYTFRFIEVYTPDVSWKFQLRHGAAAVDVFFMLSGFLETYHFKNRSLKESAIRKYLRLYPTYWCCIIITTVFVVFLLPEKKLGISSWLLNFTMLQSFIGIKSVDGAYWTLAYELVFYIVIALCQLRRGNKHVFSRVMLGWIILSFLAILAGRSNNTTIQFLVKAFNKILILDRAYAFIAGATIAYLVKGESNIYTVLSWLLSVIYIIFTDQSPWLLLFTSGLFVGLHVAENRAHISGKTNMLLRYVSKLTYPYYLLHQYIGYSILLLLLSMGFRSEAIILIPIVAVFILSILIHEFVEVRLVKYVRRRIHEREA